METEEYIEYEIINNDLHIAPAYEFMVPIVNQKAKYSIIDQSVFNKALVISEERAILQELSSSNSPIVEALQPGMHRGQPIASLKVHIARYSDSEVIITKHIRFRVYKLINEPIISSSKRSKKIVSDHPFSSGTWFKIAISKKGIYQLDTSYLTDLGINVSTINPRNIQLWGTNGFELPEANSAEKPIFSEIPILVEGESDGNFDSIDRIIFYGNSPHREFRSSSNFIHDIHPYTDSTYVFLTISGSQGQRLTTSNAGLNPTGTITSFQDLVWKEHELTKTETEQKSGRYWLGQTIPASAQNRFVSVFKDTLLDVDEDTPILASGRIYLRAQQTTAFEMQINNSLFRNFSINAISTSYTGHEGSSAISHTFNNISFMPQYTDGVLEVDLMMKNTDSGANAFIDYFKFVVTRKLTAQRNKLFFFPPSGGSISEFATYKLNNFSSQPFAFDVSDPVNPKLLSLSETSSGFDLIYHTDPESKIIVQSDLYTPASGKEIPNQNLHSINSYPEYVVVTSTELLDQAQELANYRSQKDGFNTLVVTQREILNEFSNGATDPTAIRNFLKYIWDIAIADGQVPPKYLLFFGDTTYDTKGIEKNAFTNHVLTYQTSSSIHRINSYGSDDFFGLMDDSEGPLISSGRIDLGIGRISAQTRAEARIAIDKIKRYENPENNGDWQNLFSFAGDDDFPNRYSNRDLHVENADGTLRRMNLNSVGGRSKKIYLFNYPEEITSAGRQFPAATSDFLGALNNGTLVLNYSGHGNTQNLTDEELYSSEYIPQLTNRNKLALFVTATCQFGRYDDINIQSGAEKLVFADNGGAIASFTTTRVVYTGSSPTSFNYGLNILLSQQMLEKDSEGKPSRLGDIYLRTKNTSLGSNTNSRKFILIGDPAIRIALPNKAAQLEAINQIEVASQDTSFIKALDRITLTGNIRNPNGDVAIDFSGEVTITMLDAPRDVTIPQDLDWVNDPSYGCIIGRGTDRQCIYQIENDVVFKGKSLVENGTFEITFVVPKDLSFSSEKARIIIFAKSDETTAGGAYTDVIYKGINNLAIDDGKGPSLDIYLNDPSFINGSLSNGSPNLIVELSDSSGINTTGTGVGHEIIATIDTKPQQTFVLNDFYEGTLNDYTSGRIEYPLDQIPKGNYALKVRAWDVHNNPSEKEVFFEVADQEDLVVEHVYNYPNPMNNVTSFTFEHNQQGNPLDVDIRIYTLSGKPVNRINQYIPPSNTLSSYASIPWNGRDRDNDRLGNGTYIYVLRVTTDTPEGRKTTEKIEKLVIIR